MVELKALEAARAAYQQAWNDKGDELWHANGGETDTPIRAAITAYLDNLPLPEPVAWRWRISGRKWHISEYRDIAERQNAQNTNECEPLYTAESIAKLGAHSLEGELVEALRVARASAASMPDTTSALKDDAALFLSSAAAESPSHKTAVTAAWDAYVEASMDPEISNFDAMAAAIQAYHDALASPEQEGRDG